MSNASYEVARMRLRSAVTALGYPVDLALALEAQLGTESTMLKMASYLRGAKPGSIEEIADEAIAIISFRDTWRERKISEHANAKITEFYNRPDRPGMDD